MLRAFYGPRRVGTRLNLPGRSRYNPAASILGQGGRRMARALRFVLGTLVVAVIVGLPAGYAAYRNTHFRNFRVVEPGVLYRSGQMTLAGLERIVNDHGIRTIVTLRDAEVEGER